MPTSLADHADLVLHLHRSLNTLQQQAGPLKVPSLNEREWFQLLEQKLVPQLKGDPFLIVAVVGGTNIGKSVIFNHLAGFRASSTSPLASGTKHPVCLVPEGFPQTHALPDLFGGFTLVPWRAAEAALEEVSEHRLFWRTDEKLPSTLVLLDTPDIDSDAPVNWERAERVRRASDVLIAVLTQQKYNDAAVKDFFRQAGREGKTVIVVFNQILLPDDEDIWPEWVGTFCRETKLAPESVYLSPLDRKAAESNALTFHRRPWPVDSEGGHTSELPPGSSPHTGSDLAAELSELRFEEIKLQTLTSSLSELTRSDGVPGYLEEIRAKSAEFRAIAERLLLEQAAEIDTDRAPPWPSVPRPLMAAELDRWWKPNLNPVARRVMSFYDSVTDGVTWPVRKLRELGREGEAASPWREYRDQEWNAILAAVEANFDLLEDRARTGHDLYRERFAKQLEGRSRSEFLTLLEDEHDRQNLQNVLRDVVETGMANFQQDNPTHFQAYRQMLHGAAALRPATSAVLFAFGFGPASDAVAAPLVGATGGLIADFVGGTTVMAGGDVVIERAGQSIGNSYQSKILSLHSAFRSRRLAWLMDMLKQHIWGDLPEELSRAGALPESEAFRDVLADLKNLNAITLSNSAST